MSNINVKDLGTGALFIGIGLAFVIHSMLTLDLGEVGSMGPGYFPVLLGSVLSLLGLVLAVRSFRTAGDPVGSVPWMGLVLITLAIAFFAVAVRPLGLGPAFLGTTFLACLATSRISLLQSVIVSLVLSVGCVVVFIYLLNLPYPVFGPWLRGY